MNGRRRPGRSLASLCLLATAVAPGAVAANASPSDMDTVTAAQIEEATTPIELDGRTTKIELSEATSPVAVESVEGGSTVTILASDIIFEFGRANVVQDARAAVEKAVESAPHGAKVTVDGYTDSIGDAASNIRLSTQRADAVAGVIRAKRPDLDVTTKGHGEESPVAANTSGGKDDPAGRAKNRRVQISFDAS